MTPPKYNESALDILFKGIVEKLDAILDQTSVTNGRVSTLERWRSYVAGALAVIIILLVPIMLSIVTNYVRAQ